jgi:hypothetical protein
MNVVAFIVAVLIGSDKKLLGNMQNGLGVEMVNLTTPMVKKRLKMPIRKRRNSLTLNFKGSKQNDRGKGRRFLPKKNYGFTKR